MTKEQINQLEQLSKEELITNVVILSAQYQASIELGYYFQEQLKKQQEPLKSEKRESFKDYEKKTI
ncbi:hypothetical protein [Flavobacterium sp. ABG]|uniref:hypothetical protein n=1 Tax=Flavobacterium sp. ABG TaxID=1423322 RepID=UPI0006494DAF|nr:hypothetical protein [Flavobacterium sp. ABG]KLT69910.1 hypothetical protein AB674_09405 [Flavobacterium sp. ABG]